MSSLSLNNYVSSDPRLTEGERAVSVLLGLGLTALAAQPRSNVFLSLFALATGSYLAYRGATGYCAVKASLAPPPRVPAGR